MLIRLIFIFYFFMWVNFSFSEEVLDNSQKDIYPSFTEVITLGLISSADEEEKDSAREKYESIYVTGNADSRGFLSKTLNFLTMGLFFNAEKIDAYEKRIEMEAKAKKNFVPDALDDRSFVDKGIYFLTKHESVQRETYAERNLRLEREAIQKKERQSDPRSDFERNVDLWTNGEWTPGITQAVPAHEHALGKDYPLRAVIYGQSTYQDVLNVLGTPIKSIRKPNGHITATFVKKAETYKRVPWLGVEQEVIKMSFNSKGILEDPS